MSTKKPLSALKPDPLLQGLAPLSGANPQILVLGSMPSVASLNHQQYYAHPRNAFWPLMAQLTGFELQGDYASNVKQLTAHGIAVWDVLAACQRPGSLDSNIVKGSEVLNPIAEFLKAHAGIQKIALNGGTAATLFKRHLGADLGSDKLVIFSLPSTSPANARMNFEAKCRAWRVLFDE